MAGDATLEVLLDFLKRSRGFDFSGYKRTSLERRIAKRMQDVHVEGHGDYLDYLELHPDEFEQLFNTILINVTGFYRDAPAWDYLASEILPRLVEAKAPEEPIRVWCAGCASGEETYTMAMMLCELLGEEAFADRVKIYATDVDEEALAQARAAVYPQKAVEPVPPSLVERYFERVDERYAFRKDLRRAVIFGRNDLLQDAPISRVDLLACRNTLMYFNAEAQSHIVARFHFALNGGGVLFLGRSEMLVSHADLFRAVDRKRRVFAKVVRPTLRDRLLQAVPAGLLGAGHEPLATVLRDSAFDVAPVAQVAIDHDATLVEANAAARSMFALTAHDLGRPLKDLELSYRPVELRSNIELAYAERRVVALAGISAGGADGVERVLDVQIAPLIAGGEVLGATVVFRDVTAERRLREELAESRRELETTYEELQSTVEELETTNEELQSTNEELETTNEELQSSNEELETMNEELQSTNEELETINDEMRQRTLELDEVNAFLETIMASMRVAVMVLDRRHTVEVWNAQSTDMWGLRPDEAEGQHLLSLDIGLPLDEVKRVLGTVLGGKEDRVERQVRAVNRRGKQIDVKVLCLPLRAVPDQVTGAIVITEEIAAA